MKIGKYVPKYPLIQGGMGVRISRGRLAGHVAKNGGIGLVAAAALGFDSEYYKKGEKYFEADKKALADEIKLANSISAGYGGIVGVNIMYALADFSDLVLTACTAGAQIIVVGAGLASNLPDIAKGFNQVALVPIVSSVKAAELIARKWKRRYNRIPDAIIVENYDMAGGHLGEKCENIGKGFFNAEEVIQGIKRYFISMFDYEMTVVLAGGIWDKNDVNKALLLGADGVQMASRFVCTEECDADDKFKQAYIDCCKEDIGIIESPAGLPGRAISLNIETVKNFDIENNTFCKVACLKKCTFKDNNRARFCIMGALDRSQKGDVKTGLIFCGSNSWKSEKISTVKEVIDELFET